MPTRRVPVTTAAMRLVEANPARVVLYIQNIDNALYVDVIDGGDAPGNGIRLYAHGDLALYKSQGDDPTQRWDIVGEGSSIVVVHEVFDPKMAVGSRRATAKSRESGILQARHSTTSGRGGGGGAGEIGKSVT